MKQAILGMVLLIFLLFGCISITDNSLQEMGVIQQKYFVTAGFSTNPSTMTDYISALSELKKTAAGENAKIIEAEIYLAESFNYQNKAMAESVKLNYNSINCSSEAAKSMITYIDLASKSVGYAQADYNAMSPSMREKLRENYGSLVEGYNEKIALMEDFVQTKC